MQAPSASRLTGGLGPQEAIKQAIIRSPNVFEDCYVEFDSEAFYDC